MLLLFVMAIEKIKLKNGEIRYRAIWVNPLTKKKESKSFFDKLEAQDHDLKMKRRIKDSPESVGQEQEDLLTFAEIAWEFIKSSDITDRYRRGVISVLKLSVLPVIADLEPHQITKREMSKIKSICKERGNKQNTVHGVISIVKRIFNWAVNEGIVESNPVRDYKIEHGGHLQIIPPTTGERDLIWSLAKPHVKTAIVLSTGLGVRVGRSELFKIQWSDVDFTEGTLTVRSAHKNKDIQYRIIELNPSLISILKGWHQADNEKGFDYIVNWGGKQINSMHRTWHSTLEKAGITRRIRPYDMRHYFVTEAIKAGADLKAVAEIVGHSSLTMILKHYQHTVKEQKRFAVDSIPMPTAIPNGNNNGNKGAF